MRPYESSPETALRLALVTAVMGFPLMLVDAVRRWHPVLPNHVLPLPPQSAWLAPGLRDDGPRIARHSAWVDVSEGPIVIALEGLHHRHFSLIVLDRWGERLASLSSRHGPSTYHHLMIVAPKWSGPVLTRGSAVRAPGSVAWVISRISRNPGSGPGDALDEPLPPRLSRPSLEGLEPIEAQSFELLPGPMNTIAAVTDLSPETFFWRLEALVNRYPPIDSRRRLPGLLQRLRRVRDVARAEGPDRAHRNAVARGLTAGLSMIRTVAEGRGEADAGQWARDCPGGDDAVRSMLARAAEAWRVLGAPPAVELVQFRCSRDTDGNLLHGGESYALHFAPGALPPVNAFWDLSLIREDGADQQGAGASSLRSDGPPVLDGQGGLRVLIQAEEPLGAGAANWLRPSPGRFSLTMRLNWPHNSVVRGAWRMPAVERVAVLQRYAPQPFAMGSTTFAPTTAGWRGLH